jgi:antitoxin (DNA-binding transcriptional repressor) of toxin-antitoxin stability system
MLVTTTREFREKQGQYLGRVANGENLVLLSRKFGSFKIIPITNDDTIISLEEMNKKIDNARKQYKGGNYKILTPELRKQLFSGL